MEKLKSLWKARRHIQKRRSWRAVWGAIHETCAWFGGVFLTPELPSCGIIFQRNFLRFLPPSWSGCGKNGEGDGKNDFQNGSSGESEKSLQIHIARCSWILFSFTEQKVILDFQQHQPFLSSTDHLVSVVRKATSYEEGAERKFFIFSSNRFFWFCWPLAFPHWDDWTARNRIIQLTSSDSIFERRKNLLGDFCRKTGFFVTVKLNPFVLCFYEFSCPSIFEWLRKFCRRNRS